MVDKDNNNNKVVWVQLGGECYFNKNIYKSFNDFKRQIERFNKVIEQNKSKKDDLDNVFLHHIRNYNSKLTIKDGKRFVSNDSDEVLKNFIKNN